MLLVDHLKTHLKKDVLFTAFPAGGGGRVRGAKLKKAGLQAGWPDIQLIYKGQYYGLEVKTPQGRLSPSQSRLHQKLIEGGCKVAVVRSVKEMMEHIIDWGLVRRYKQTMESGSPTGSP
jgi:hypothetical protein